MQPANTIEPRTTVAICFRIFIIVSFSRLLEIKLKTHYKLSCRGVICSRTLRTRSKTVHLIGRWVYTAEFGQSKYILDSAVYSEPVHKTAGGKGQRVADCQHIELEVVASFKEVVAYHRICVRVNVEVLSIGFPEHIAGEISCAIIEVMNIENVESECATEKQRQVKVLITEVVTG